MKQNIKTILTHLSNQSYAITGKEILSSMEPAEQGEVGGYRQIVCTLNNMKTAKLVENGISEFDDDSKTLLTWKITKLGEQELKKSTDEAEVVNEKPTPLNEESTSDELIDGVESALKTISDAFKSAMQIKPAPKVVQKKLILAALKTVTDNAMIVPDLREGFQLAHDVIDQLEEA
jgi:rubrerythrin